MKSFESSYWSTVATRRVTRRRTLALTGGAALGAAFLAACGGDSGSPVVTTDGKAAGNFTHLIVHTGYLGNDLAGMRATAILRFAGVSLVNADGSTTSGPTSNGCGTDPEW